MWQQLLHGWSDLPGLGQHWRLLQCRADRVCGPVLHGAVHWQRVLQRPFTGVWADVLPGRFTVPHGALLSSNPGLQPAVLPVWQCMHQQPVRAAWQHALRHVFLRVR